MNRPRITRCHLGLHDPRTSNCSGEDLQSKPLGLLRFDVPVQPQALILVGLVLKWAAFTYLKKNQASPLDWKVIFQERSDLDPARAEGRIRGGIRIQQTSNRGICILRILETRRHIPELNGGILARLDELLGPSNQYLQKFGQMNGKP